jgi:phosphate transport system substrate-binding protein
MFDRLSAIRSFGPKALIGLFAVLALSTAACGSTTSSPPASTTATTSPLTSCTVSSADLVPTTTSKGTSPAAPGVSGKLAMDGSTALAPLFQQAGTEFQTANSSVQITITPNGSGTGLKDVAAGAVSIGMSDVFASEKLTAAQAATLTDHQVAAVVFTLVTNTDLKGRVGNLTTDQIVKIYTGGYTNWSQLGGPNEAITVINRPTTSGTRATFKKYVLNGTAETAGTTLTQETTGAVLQAIKGTPGSIGYVSLSFVAGNASDVSPICIDGNKATAADVNSGNYKFWGIEHAYTKGQAAGNAKAFLQYIVSDQIQKNDLLYLAYLPLTTVSASAISAHTVSGAPTPEQLTPLS